MALVLRTNGAPLSGALFVSNPRKRKSRPKRRNGIALRTNRRNRRNRRNRTNRRNAALRAMRNRKNRRNRRNTMLLNYHGNGLALQRNRRNRRNRRNAAHRRNSYGAFQNKLTRPVENTLSKGGAVGKAAAQYVAPLVMGVVVGGVHYGALYALSKIPGADGLLEKVKPVQFTLTGVAAATALRFIPVGSKQIRDQLAVGALLAGSAIDVYRMLSNKMGDLGDLYEDGFIEAGDLYEDGFVEVGDGGMYDVVPLSDGTAVDYSGASMMDAAAAPVDLSVDEGEAALSGAHSWINRFGLPVYAPRRRAGYSTMAGRPGHRFGWLIQLVGFGRFQKIASLPPGKRVALIAQLKQQAVSSVDGYSGIALDMAGLALDMNGGHMGGMHMNGGHMGGLALDMNGSTLDFSGELSGLALDMNGMGAVMHAGSTI